MMQNRYYNNRNFNIIKKINRFILKKSNFIAEQDFLFKINLTIIRKKACLFSKSLHFLHDYHLYTAIYWTQQHIVVHHENLTLGTFSWYDVIDFVRNGVWASSESTSVPSGKIILPFSLVPSLYLQSSALHYCCVWTLWFTPQLIHSSVIIIAICCSIWYWN
jgi:hypothetical protein